MEQLWMKRRSACVTSQWSGGETTEFFIYPETASYSSRNFSFRISSATVTQPRSTFSALSGYYRYLTPLDQPITLNYQGHGSVDLAPLEVAGFDGGWTTESIGACRDFNVMINKSEGWQAEINVLTDSDRLTCKGAFTGVLALTEPIELENKTEGLAIKLNKGDFLLFQTDEPFTVVVKPSTVERVLIQVTIDKE